jgi:hypothetical protein
MSSIGGASPPLRGGEFSFFPFWARYKTGAVFIASPSIIHTVSSSRKSPPQGWPRSGPPQAVTKKKLPAGAAMLIKYTPSVYNNNMQTKFTLRSHI